MAMSPAPMPESRRHLRRLAWVWTLSIALALVLGWIAVHLYVAAVVID